MSANGYTVRRGRIYEISSGKGGLNLSRAIGDLMYREGVTCTPDVTTLQLDDSHDIAILASDGLWDDLSNEAACKVARGISDLDKAASALVAEAYALGSQDNITALVVDLKKKN